MGLRLTGCSVQQLDLVPHHCKGMHKTYSGLSIEMVGTESQGADCDMLLLWGHPRPSDSSTVVRMLCVDSSSSSLILSRACSFTTLSSCS